MDSEPCLRAMECRRSAISARASSQEMRAKRGSSLALRYCGFGTGAAERVEEARGRVFVFEIAGYFGAEEASGDGVIGIAAEAVAAILVVDIDEQRTGVGTIEGADGVDCAGHVHSIISDGALKISTLIL